MLYKSVFVIALLAWATSLSMADVDVVRNPAFSGDLRSWQVPPAGWLSAQNALMPQYEGEASRSTGSGSVKFVGEGTKHALLFQEHPVQAQQIKLAGWVKGEDFNPGWIGRIIVHCRGKNNAYLGNVVISVPGASLQDGQWRLFERAATLPEGTESLRLDLDTAPRNAENPPANTGTIWFDEVSLTFSGEPMAKGYAPIIAYPLGQTKGILFEGEPVRLALANAPAGLSDSVKVEVVDFYGRKIREPVECPLMTDGDTRYVQFDHRGGLGYFVVRMTVRDSAGNVLGEPLETGYGVVPEGKGDNDRFFGVSAFRNKPWMLPALARLGTGFTIALTTWRTMEPTKGEYNFSLVEKWLKANEEHGMDTEVLVSVQSPLERDWVVPKWELERLEQNGSLAPDMDYYENYSRALQAFVSRYCDQVSKWYFFSEVNVYMRKGAEPSFSDYVDVVSILSEAAREVCPDITIAGIGVAGDDSQAIPAFPASRAFWEELHDYVDEFWPHIYSLQRVLTEGSRPLLPETFMRQALLEALDVIEPYGKSVLGNSENGYSLDVRVGLTHPLQRLFASLTARAIILYRSVPQAHSYCFFTVLPADEGNNNIAYGLWMDQSGGQLNAYMAMDEDTPIWPRPAAVAYATCAHLLRDVDERATLNIREGLQCHGFRCKENSVFAVWSMTPSTLEFQSTVRLEKIDLMGGSVGWIEPGPVSLALTDEPFFLVAGTEDFYSVKHSLELSESTLPMIDLAVAQGDGDSLNIIIKNNEGNAVTADISCVVDGEQMPVGLVHLEPNQIRTIPFEIIAREEVVAVAELDGKHIEAKLPIDTIEIPRAGVSAPVELDLGNAEYLQPPDAVAGGLWKPGECVFRPNLSYDDDYLYINAVIDNVRPIQTAKVSDDLWKQDSLVIAIDAANDALPLDFTGKPGYDDDDLELVVGLTDHGPMASLLVNGKHVELPEGLVYDVVQNGKQVRYSIKIPWNAMSPLSAEAGKCFKMNLLYAHAATKDSQLTYWFCLTPGIHGSPKNPYVYRSFKLAQDTALDPH